MIESNPGQLDLSLCNLITRGDNFGPRNRPMDTKRGHAAHWENVFRENEVSDE